MVKSEFFLKSFDPETPEDIQGSIFRVLPPFKYHMIEKIQNIIENWSHDKKSLDEIQKHRYWLDQEININLAFFNK
jgi:aspartyl/asparaginyl beta-hydroxylase (cupin superfamily)